MGSASVLIVEDERLVAKDLQESLLEWGYGPVAIASSCEEALTQVERQIPDIVLMDIRIKGPLDGIDTAKRLREECEAPVIFLTAHADQSHLERAKPTQPNGYLLKPIKGPELRVAVEIGLHRHRSDRALRERDRWYFATLCAIAEAVVTIDQEGCVTFMNPSAERLSGQRLSESMGKPIGDVLQLLSLEETQQIPALLALRENRCIEAWSGVLKCPQSGNMLKISESAAPVKDGGKTLGAVMIFRDTTPEVTLRQQLELSQRLASLGTLAAGVAHEINNPLTAVLGGVTYVQDLIRENRQIFRDVKALSDIEEVLDHVTDSTARIRRIVADLKGFCSTSLPSEPRSDLLRCVEWALRMTAHEFGDRAQVVRELMPTADIALDETRIGQILVNLLINAAQATPAGTSKEHTVTVRTRAHEDGRAVVEIVDSGVGIAGEHLNQIFDPFFTTKGPCQGTGLGLAIVHGIVSKAGGEIAVESQLGSGTTFRVILPTRPS